MTEKAGETDFLRDLVRAAGMTGISSSQVSRLCQSIDERVAAFLSRPIERRWPSLWLEATDVKARDGGRMVSKACVLAVAVNTEGRREVLGFAVGPAETEAFWKQFLRDLIGRGLAGVQWVISDAHAGLKKAVAQVLAHVHQRPQSRVAAITRLVGAVVLEQSEEWQVGRCYMATHSLAELRDNEAESPEQIEHAA